MHACLHVLKANAWAQVLLRLREQVLRVGRRLLEVWALASLRLRLLHRLLIGALLPLLLLLVLLLGLVLMRGQGRSIPSLHAGHLEGVGAPWHARHGALRVDEALWQPWQFLRGADSSSTGQTLPAQRTLSCLQDSLTPAVWGHPEHLRQDLDAAA